MGTKKQEKVESLDEFLMNYEVDLSKEKPTLFKVEGSVAKAAGAWQQNEEGIRAVLESRAMELRHHILFKCQAFELPIYRERLLEIAAVIKMFKDSVPAAERIAEKNNRERDDEIDEATSEDEDIEEDSDDNSSM